MKKNKFYCKKLIVAIILSFLFVGCSTNDDDSNPGEERSIITMEIPDGEINWNSVELVWREEFNGATNLSDIWFYELKNTTNPDVSDQLQTYSQKNVSMSGGTLKISAKKEEGNYTSARLNSKYAFEYGRIEMSVKLPEQKKNGIWAKLALIGNNKNSVGWPQAGEMDFMEYFSYKPNEIHTIVHSAAGTIGGINLMETPLEGFHVHGILWTDKYIKFYIDDIDNIIYTFNRPSNPTEQNWPFNKPFYLLVDMVIGGRYAGAQGVDDSLFPAVMEIDYIRVYHLD